MNPKAPKVRRDAAQLVLQKGMGIRTVARKYGVSPGTITKWVKKARAVGIHPIPTRSSRPKHTPNRISDEVRDKVGKKRIELGRSIEVIHHALKEEGIHLGVSSVYRILKSQYLIKRRSLWKRYHPKTPRPLPLSPGDLVQIDTIHLQNQWKERIYVYTIIDVYSRTAFARCYQRYSTYVSLDFLRRTKEIFPFMISCIQSDHGPEFGAHFTRMAGMRHRHSRVRKPNDNAHVERFNRTIQEECLRGIPLDVAKINKALQIYLTYYNTERHHFSLKFRAPSDILQPSGVSKV